jgi:hypothetical protein
MRAWRRQYRCCWGNHRIQEKKYTLLIAKELEKELLLENANVFMTRTKDTSLSMPERIGMLKNEISRFPGQHSHSIPRTGTA